MQAMVYRGPFKIRVEEKDIPRIEHPNDAIVRVTLAAICGSDLHLYHGMMPDTRIGTTFGHEFIGVVHEVGPSVQHLKVELSSSEQAEFMLDAETLHLRTPVLRRDFEQWISPELERMQASLEALLQETNTSPNAVDRVFLTGGTSLVPAVRRVFTDRFGEDRVQSGEAFTSVAYGLALMAEQLDASAS